MLSLFLSIIALGLIITVHELGHFLFAKLFGAGVVEFSLGMGPKLFSFVKGETRYSLKLLPFGGSCLIVGEDMEEIPEPEAARGEAESFFEAKAETGASAQKEEQRTETKEEAEASQNRIVIDGRSYGRHQQFSAKAPWQRFLILAAGAGFNFLLAFLLSVFLTAEIGYDKPFVVEAEAGMPLYEAGLDAGDIISGIGFSKRPKKVTASRDISMFLLVNQERLNAGETVTLRFLDASDGFSERSAEVSPKYSEKTKSYRLGMSFNTGYEPTKNGLELLKYSAYNVKYCIKATVESLKLMVRGQVDKDDVMGPVRMVATMDETVSVAADYGFKTVLLSLFDMMILISGSLGAMNLLPIPALDGGRIFFILIEMLTGRRVPPKLEGMVHAAGMAILLFLMVFILFNDVLFLLR